MSVRLLRPKYRAVRFAGNAIRTLVAAFALITLLGGLPWALTRFVGWPLPDHLPTRDEVEITIFSPMSASLLLDFLACVCWVIWLVFVADVVRCVRVAVRGRKPMHLDTSPIRRVAAALVGSIVLAVLGNRTVSAQLENADVRAATGVHATAIVHSGPLHKDRKPWASSPVGHAAAVPPGMVQVTEEVRLPAGGVYDSLWRIAERVLGDGDRWPELYELNRGVVQPDGRRLTSPNLIRPGWRITAHVEAPMPAAAHPTDDPPSKVASPAEAAPQTTPEQDYPSTESRRHNPGVVLETGAFVSLALAAAISAAVMSARMWRRRHYRIGSGDRADMRRPAPVVEALEALEADCEVATEASGPSAAVGVRGDHEVMLSLASIRGLGLVGPGAVSAARALLLHIVAQQRDRGDDVRVLVPEVDLEYLFGTGDSDSLPAEVAVIASLDDALDEMERALSSCTNYSPTNHADERAFPPNLVLCAKPAAHAEKRLQSLLDNGSTYGITGILLGQWSAGTTVRVREDGIVSAASPDVDDSLLGTRLFTLPASDASDLLAVLRDMEDETGDVARQRPSVKSTPDDPAALRPLFLRILGRTEVIFRHDSVDREICALTSKQREILVYLALHPQGTRREALNDAIWPDSCPPRPFNSLHNALSLLRRALNDATEGAINNLVVNDNGRYHLDTGLVTTDYERFQHGLTTPRSASRDAMAPLGEAVELYRGHLAEDLAPNWIEPFRESTRRDVLGALSALIHALDERDPQVLVLLEQARKLDRYNEGTYRDIMRAQARLGQHSGIPRTLALLTASLEEIDQRPTSDSVALADHLLRPEQLGRNLR